jgi:hypothetical protein
LIWDANGNGQFDPGGNGEWDNDAVISDAAIIVPTFEGTTDPAITPFFVGPFEPSDIQAGPVDLELGMFNEDGICIAGAQTDVQAIVEDFKDRPVGPGEPVYFFVETFRGSIDPIAPTSEGGVAFATFRSKCPDNFMDEITVVAVVFGREPFTDLNNNEQWDPGEPFVDLPNEVFLDANLNGIFEPGLGDFLIWDPNGNGVYDGAPNGVYDTDILLSSTSFIIPVEGNDIQPTPLPTMSEGGGGGGGVVPTPTATAGPRSR